MATQAELFQSPCRDWWPSSPQGPSHAQAVYVACKSTDPGAVVRKYCSVGCIGCKACERVCTFSAVSVDQGLASIQPDLCEACMKCVEACKPATIRLTRAPEAKEAAHA